MTFDELRDIWCHLMKTDGWRTRECRRGGGLWVLRSAAGVHSMAKLDNAPGAPLPEEAFSCRVQTSLETMAEIASGATSRRRGCHFADTPSPSLLKYLLKGQGAAAE